MLRHFKPHCFATVKTRLNVVLIVVACGKVVGTNILSGSAADMQPILPCTRRTASQYNGQFVIKIKF